MTLATMAVAHRTVDLAVWLEKANIAQQLAEKLVSSAFVPPSYRVGQNGRLSREEVVANATSSILLGDSLGVDPLTALQNIYIINGRPGMYTNFKVALLQAHGYEIVTVERSPQRCTVKGRKMGTPVEHPWTEITITFEDAQNAGWTRNAQYRNVPADMLYARTAGRVCDMLGADILHGLATAEDLVDYDDEPDVRGPAIRTPSPLNENMVRRAVGGGNVAELIQRSPEADRRLADVVERDKHPELAETAPAPAETPTERVRQRRSAEKLGLGEDDGGDGMAWVPDEKHGGRPEERVTREQALRNQEGTGVLVPTVEVVEATPEEVVGDVLGGVVVDEYSEIGPDVHETEPVEEIADDPATWPQPMITTQRWNEINELFNKKHGVNGEGMKVARFRVIRSVIGRSIENGRELTAAEAEKIHFFLSGTSTETVNEIAYKEES